MKSELMRIGFSTLTLKVYDWNEQAILAYQSYGFQEVGFQKYANFSPRHNRVVDMIQMGMKLTRNYY